MTVLTEGRHTGEFILSEGNGSISREQVILAPTTVPLAAGRVLGRLTASGKFVAYDNAGEDGAEVAVAVLYADAPVSTVDQTVVVIARSAEVQGSALTGLDAAGTTDLLTAGIIVR